AASLQYNTDLFYSETAGRLLQNFRELLNSIAADPARRVSELNLLHPDEQRLLLSEWNETGRDVPMNLSVHQMFEAQAKMTPDALDVSLGIDHLSYGGLNQRGDELAEHLRSLGIKQEMLVGVCLPRSADMVVAVLAVLKTGGAYVPLDPAYPAERLG